MGIAGAMSDNRALSEWRQHGIHRSSSTYIDLKSFAPNFSSKLYQSSSFMRDSELKVHREETNPLEPGSGRCDASNYQFIMGKSATKLANKLAYKLAILLYHEVEFRSFDVFAHLLLEWSYTGHEGIRIIAGNSDRSTHAMWEGNWVDGMSHPSKRDVEP